MAAAAVTQNHRSRINSMLSVWYGIVFGCLQAFLIVQNVHKFVKLAERSWYQRTPFLELNSYIILTGVSVVMLPFFVASAVFRVGNTANDNRLLGKHLNSRDEWAPLFVSSMLFQNTRGFFRTVWTHCGPTSSFIHIISSFCLLVPQTLMEAALLKFEFLPNDSVWRTDLDALISQADRNEILKVYAGNDARNSTVNGYPMFMDSAKGVMRLNYLNYGLAVTIFSLRYASVFWHSNKAFATVFSLQVLISTAHTMISYSAFTVLFKVQALGTLKLLHKSMPFLLCSYTVLLLHVVSVSIILASSSVLYHYGYLKVVAFVNKKVMSTCITNHGRRSLGLWAYFPHCSALAVFLALAASQSPLIHDTTLLYNATFDNCLLAYIISTGVHFLVWIVLWILLTGKRDWKFVVSVKVGNVQVGDLEGLKLAAEICLGDPSDSSTITPMSSSMLVVSGGKAFAIGDPIAQSRIIEILHPNSGLSREGESADRIYWPRSCPPTQTCNSLEDEIQPWLKDSKECAARNKVTFYDDVGSPRKYCSVPVSRNGGMKRSFREQSYTEVKQHDDEGDYAVLKRGKGCLKPQLPREVETEEIHQVTRYPVVHPTIPGPHRYDPNYPVTVLRQNANLPQATPRSVLSTDSGYPGTVESACRSDSRSASSTGSPPDRTAHSDSSSSGVHSNSTFTGGLPNQVGDCCPQDCCADPYGKIGLMRRESIRSSVNPGFDSSMSHGKNPSNIYQSRSRPKSQMEGENPYGETRRVSHEASMNVAMSLESPPYHPATYTHQQALNSTSSSKYTNINTANEIAERQEMEKIYGRTNGQQHSSLDLCMNSPIQSTPYGRCTNMKLSSFADYGITSPNNDRVQVPLPLPSTADSFVPPTPPPLPELSFSCLQAGGRGGRTVDDVLKTRYSSPHTTLPNGSSPGRYQGPQC